MLRCHSLSTRILLDKVISSLQYTRPSGLVQNLLDVKNQGEFVFKTRGHP